VASNISNKNLAEHFARAGALYEQHRNYEANAFGKPLSREEKIAIAPILRAIGLFLKGGGQNMIAAGFLSDSVYFSCLEKP